MTTSTLSAQTESRWLAHRAAAHRMRRVNAPLNEIAKQLRVSKRSVSRYLNLPDPQQEPVTLPEPPEPGLAEFYMKGACASFPELDWSSRRPTMQARCKEVCAGCPVLEQCRAFGLGAGADNVGVWGGLSTSERRRILLESGQGGQADEDASDQGAA